MSAPLGNAAAQQTTSKFQAFLNHPAGPKYVYLETTFLGSDGTLRVGY